MTARKSGAFLLGETPSEESAFHGSSNLIAAARKLIALAIPIMGSNILGLLDGSINAVWVGRFLGENALAATSNANTVLIFLFALALGIWTTLTIQVGFYLGNNRSDDTTRLVRAATVVFLVVGILIAVAGEVLSVQILKALKVPPECLEQAEEYLRVILIAVPIGYVYGMIISALRGGGDTTTTFYFSLLSLGLDVGLNPVFIFGLGPMPRMGIRGAALATVVSQSVGLGALIIFLLQQKHSFCLLRGRFVMRSAEWRAARDLLRRGGPMGAEFLGESLLAILMISLVNRFGANVTAAFGAANQLWNCAMMPSVALSLATTSLVAKALGAGDCMEARTITRIGVIFSVVSTGLLLVALACLGGRIFALFLPTHSPALPIAPGINRVASWACVAFAGCGTLMGMPRASGAVWGPFTISLVGILARLLLAQELLYQWHAQGIWWSFPISGVITIIATVLYYRYGGWESRWSWT